MNERIRVVGGFIAKRGGIQSVITVGGVVYGPEERVKAMTAILPGLGDIECDVVPVGA